MIVGLTGGIGSGKSEVSRRFQALGVCVVDADEVARQVVAPVSPQHTHLQENNSALGRIAAHFGNGILNSTGTLNRAALRAIIFNNPQEKIWLENLLHPIIHAEIVQQLQNAKSTYSMLVSPLLLETTQHQLVDRILVVDVDEELQLKRATERDNNSREHIKTIMATQMSRVDRCAKADDIIHNHGDLNELDEQIQRLHAYYLTQAIQ